MGMEKNKSTFWENYRFPLTLIAGIAIGSIIGPRIWREGNNIKALRGHIH